MPDESGKRERKRKFTGRGKGRFLRGFAAFCP